MLYTTEATEPAVVVIESSSIVFLAQSWRFSTSAAIKAPHKVSDLANNKALKKSPKVHHKLWEIY